MVDHENRIPKPGDYFVFEYGSGDSVIILRDKAGAVAAFHNVCRHRGSRLCRHDDDPAPKDVRLSVKQLGSNGNTPVFRCPYHAWTYDLSGSLISAPNGMPADFKMAENGLRPCHVKTSEGFIFVNLRSRRGAGFRLRRQELRGGCEGVRHGRSEDRRPRQRADESQLEARARELPGVLSLRAGASRAGHRASVLGRSDGTGSAHPARERAGAICNRSRTGRSGQRASSRYGTDSAGCRATEAMCSASGMVSGTLDGKPAATLLPTRKEWTHRSRLVSTSWSTGLSAVLRRPCRLRTLHAPRRQPDRRRAVLAGGR